MASPALTTASSTRCIKHYGDCLLDDNAPLVEAPATRNRAARGILAGVLLGGGFWGAILVLTGIIKL